MICSPCELKNELNKIRVLLEENGYPTAVINSVIKKKLSNASTSPVYGPKKCDVYIKLPWLGEKSEKFGHLISKAVVSTFNAVKVCPVFSSTPILPSSQKDVLPSHEKSQIIYQFKCAHCESAYVGKTSRRLCERIVEHVPSSIRNKKYKIEKLKSYDTAIGAHLKKNLECALSYQSECFSVLKKARSSFHLSVMEAVTINDECPILCRQKKFVYATKLFPSFTASQERCNQRSTQENASNFEVSGSLPSQL